MLKPKDLAIRLQIPATDVSIILRDISTVYTFEQTPFGSFLIKEEEIEYIKLYRNALFFLRNKKLALEQLQSYIDENKTKDLGPNWLFMIKNGVHAF